MTHVCRPPLVAFPDVVWECGDCQRRWAYIAEHPRRAPWWRRTLPTWLGLWRIRSYRARLADDRHRVVPIGGLPARKIHVVLDRGPFRSTVRVWSALLDPPHRSGLVSSTGALRDARAERVWARCVEEVERGTDPRTLGDLEDLT